MSDVNDSSVKTVLQHNFKLLIIGDSGVGKTSILSVFANGTFDEHTRNTVGVDLKVKMINIKDKLVRAVIWDTAGQERFRTLTSAYYRGAHGVILVYDMTSRPSFDHLKVWLRELTHYATTDPVIIIAANKADRKEERTVSSAEGLLYAREQEALYIETSAKTQQGVQQAFEELIQKILDKPELCYEVEEKPITLDTSHSSESYCGYC